MAIAIKRNKIIVKGGLLDKVTEQRPSGGDSKLGDSWRGGCSCKNSKRKYMLEERDA